jgi:cellobiose phosphorylase
LGLRREGNKLTFSPCVPNQWQSFKVHYKYYNTLYHIDFIRVNNLEATIATVDDIIIENKIIVLKDDGIEHACVVKFCD